MPKSMCIKHLVAVGTDSFIVLICFNPDIDSKYILLEHC